MVGHLRTQCTNNPTIPTSSSNSTNPTSDSSTLTPGVNSITPTIKETTFQYSTPVAPNTATTTAFAFNTTTINDGDSLLNCAQCDRTFTSRIGLVGHLRIQRTETASTNFSCQHCACNFNSRIGLVGHLRIHHTEAGEPVHGAPTYSRRARRARLHCPHCSRIFTHRLGLLGHMRLNDNLR
ncbi:unnamed protein product [Schistocephalus solidus]|uniref:C2H2-type domain-containing protein n=1 Tax=Schistocephalus solidus TaxID=70667 RepID=A0A3P7D746_SCHSO|nr:unnamed protein product [Schistocephalus solidus]